MIKIQYTLILAVIISLILSLEYSSAIKFATGQMQKESNLIMYDDNNNSTNPILINSNDSILKPKVGVSIEGTPKSDKLIGSDGNDEIKGGKGNDILYGKDGNDEIKGGEGKDRISGGRGDDELEGEKGNDMLFGGEGDDLIGGGIGNDVLEGGKGIDIMIGGPGNDTFICDQYDTIIDYNSTEEDQIIGSCSVQYEEEKQIPDNNISQEEFQSPPLPLNPNDIPLPEEFQSGPPQFYTNDIPPSEFQSPSPPPPSPHLLQPFHPGDIPPSFEPRPSSDFQLPSPLLLPTPLFTDRDTIG